MSKVNKSKLIKSQVTKHQLRQDELWRKIKLLSKKHSEEGLSKNERKKLTKLIRKAPREAKEFVDKHFGEDI